MRIQELNMDHIEDSKTYGCYFLRNLGMINLTEGQLHIDIFCELIGNKTPLSFGVYQDRGFHRNGFGKIKKLVIREQNTSD